ncbi:hypothetical protein [Halobacterium salinarum]|uniref:hypothetical protein n=1 Tax=Halobacterium salinarum TaxID=2242 RepID=UPI001F2B23BF|nr:hypothetical protein [Halobacterium salinarum]MCF2164623.1 hypothetical protein [Halobacterium salinarum]MCF2166931.1 hypothetical protein [Halobacterium salinarum]
MHRRPFLSRLCLGAVAATAGCLSRRDDRDYSATSRTRSTGTDASPPPSADRTRVAAGDTARRTVGTGSLDAGGLRRPARIAFTNPTSEPHDGTLTISRRGERVLDEPVTLAADASLVASLTDLDAYTARVSGPTLRGEQTATLRPGGFTCNATSTAITVQDDATLSSTRVSTRMACPGVVTDDVAAGDTATETVGAAGAGGDYALRLWNATAASWTTRLRVDTDSTPRFDGVYTLAPDSTAVVRLRDRRAYTASMRVLGTEATATARVTPADFDCPSAATRVSIDAAGSLSVARDPSASCTTSSV